MLFNACQEKDNTSNHIEEQKENTGLETIHFTEEVIKKTGYLDDFSIDSVSRKKDTIEYYFTDNYYTYYSDVNLSQQIQYLFQDFHRLIKIKYKVISIFYTYPKRKDSDKILVFQMNMDDFINELEFFKYNSVHSLINELHILDSEYGQVNIIEALTGYLDIARAELTNTKAEIFGLNVNQFIVGYLFNCAGEEDIYKKVLQKALEIIVEQKIAYPAVANEVDELFKKHCKEVEHINTQLKEQRL